MLDRERSQVKLLATYIGSPLTKPPDEQVFDLDEVPIFRQVMDQNKPLVITDAQANPLLLGMQDLLQTLEASFALVRTSACSQ